MPRNACAVLWDLALGQRGRNAIEGRLQTAGEPAEPATDAHHEFPVPPASRVTNVGGARDNDLQLEVLRTHLADQCGNAFDVFGNKARRTAINEELATSKPQGMWAVACQNWLQYSTVRPVDRPPVRPPRPPAPLVQARLVPRHVLKNPE